jgi:hypothetical protein
MGTLSFWHLIVLLLLTVGVAVPLAKILRRAGFSRWWCLLYFVPLANFVGLWIFAYATWPNLPVSRATN